ncbi:MAG: hypothetical protein HYX24_02725 [Candidatus Aenigmarchaeota archaeon]|nr:hypothetical protein [Candidatus Aenigmarchaeota archaeon]
MKNAKGQMLLEFVIAALIFFGILFFIISLLNTNVSRYSLSAVADSLESKAVRVSEMLLSEGMWDNGTYSPGLVAGRNVIDYGKLGRFRELCENNYTYVQLLLGLTTQGMAGKNAKDFYISIDDDRKNVMECGGKQRPATSANIRRYALSQNNTIVSLDIFVW